MDRAFYDRYFQLEDSHWWFAGRRRIILDEAERALTGDGGGRPEILDIGCGTGVTLGALSRLGNVRGTEMEAAAVEYCRRRGFADVAVAGEPPLPFADASFDLITMLDVLEHIDDDVGMVSEVRRLLRPGGHLILTVPAFPSLWGQQDDISHHKRRYVRSTIREAVEGGGLALERLSHFNTILFPPIAAIRLARRVHPPSGELSSDFELTKPGRVNDLLGRVFASEAGWLARRDLPFGVSLLAVAARPGAA